MRGLYGDWRHCRARLLGILAALTFVGCGGSGGAFEFLGSPFSSFTPQSVTTGPTTSGVQSGTTSSGSQASAVDPCAETQSRKLIRISMRNQSSDFVHYFLVFIAFENSTTYPTGAVCPADRSLYTAFGYTYVPAGTTQPFGDYCIVGPALYYFHQAGQFRGTGGTGASSLAAAIGPAQGATPTYDNAFTSAGLAVPVPDIILFHNPGSNAEGQSLKVSQSVASPCNPTGIQTADPVCAQDSFYYVDESDLRAGSTALGVGSGRRVPSEIQGTACECLGTALGYQILAASSSTATAARCDEFFRGGRIDYVFVRDDTNPPYPQLLWRVTDSSGARAHDFDSRANIQ